ncbi:MAG: hypothetical protein ACR2KV_00665 [Solirubrobacteraceae bacterium]
MTSKRIVLATVAGSGAIALTFGGSVLAASPHHHPGVAAVGQKFVALSKDAATDASPSKQVAVRCPKGYVAIGGGAHLHFPGEPAGIVPLAITQSRPNPDASAHPTGWVAAGNATSAFASNWSIEVHVICGR